MTALGRICFLVLALSVLCLPACAEAQDTAPAAAPAASPRPTNTAAAVAALFEPEARNARVMQIEAAIAQAQADFGVVSQAAAQEIADKADPRYAPLADVEAENDIVRHRMVALLNVWRRSLSEDASNALHRGVTTVDVYDTVLVLQLIDAIDVMLADMRALEEAHLCLAANHADTPMIGRTLGQHALPITFGKKVAVWAGQNRRNIDRLYEVRARLASSGVLKGAVGSHLGLGPDGPAIEAGVSERLGLAPPEPADWRPARDTFAEYALTLALIAKSHAHVGGEVFRLQMTDIGEVYERRPATAVGSSAMPHKRNPSLSEALIHHGRTIPALSEVILADVESVFERDNTSRPNRTLEEITIAGANMVRDTRRLIARLDIDEAAMAANLARTDGMIMAQRIVLFLDGTVAKHEAEERVRVAAERSLNDGVSFRQALLDDPVLAPALSADLDALLDPTTSLGLASDQVTRTRAWIAQARSTRGEPALGTCGP